MKIKILLISFLTLTAISILPAKAQSTKPVFSALPVNQATILIHKVGAVKKEVLFLEVANSSNINIDNRIQKGVLEFSIPDPQNDFAAILYLSSDNPSHQCTLYLSGEHAEKIGIKVTLKTQNTSFMGCDIDSANISRSMEGSTITYQINVQPKGNST